MEKQGIIKPGLTPPDPENKEKQASINDLEQDPASVVARLVRDMLLKDDCKPGKC